MKKIILGLGTLTIVAIPTAMVVSCGEDDAASLTNTVAKTNTDKIVKAIDRLTDAIKGIK